MLKPGVRVVRGPNWFWDNQDGGEGHVGTVTEIGTPESEKTVVVQWDNGNRSNCRVGYMDKYDLRVIDNAQIGVLHRSVTCDECGSTGMRGLRYKCNVCYDYDLCYRCYHGDKHDLNHSFRRIDFPKTQGVNLPPRLTFNKCELRGIFGGARVMRGFDWEWSNQDGGEGKTGIVLDIRGWDNKSYRSTANVQWVFGNKDVYRIGHKGYCDIKFVESSSGGYYYPEHLPVLGQTEEQMELNLIIDTIEIQQVRELENSEKVPHSSKEVYVEEWKAEKKSTLASLSPMESFYASIVIDYNHAVNRDLKPIMFVDEFFKVGDVFKDDDIKEMWSIIKYMSQLPPVAETEDINKVRFSNTFIEAKLQQGKKFLEDRFKSYMVNVLHENMATADTLSVYDLVHSFVGLRFQGDYFGLQDGKVDGRPVWPMVFYCLRLGDLSAAINCLKKCDVKFTTVISILEAKLNCADSPLVAILEENMKHRTLDTNDTDPFKRIIWTIFSCRDELSEIIRTEDDYLWLKLNLIRVDYEGECLKYEDFQCTILEEQGESYYNAFNKPLLYFKLLALTGQLEAAIEFLFRTEKFKVHSVHMAIALEERNLLALPQDSTSPLISIDPLDPKPGRRLNLALLIKNYVSKFETYCLNGALHYYFLLRNCDKLYTENLFDLYVSDLVINTKQYEKILGRFHKNAMKTKGLIDQFKNTTVTANGVAERLVSMDQCEEAIDLHSAINNQEGVLSLMCTLLSKVAHLEGKPDSLRNRLQEKSSAIDELYTKQGYDTTFPNVVNSFIKLKGLLTFFDMYRIKQYPEALKILINLKIVPLRFEELNERLENMRNYTTDFYKVIPDVLLATMTILLSQCDKIKKVYETDETLHESMEKHQRCVWEQANCITNFTERLSTTITKNVNGKLTQMEILMHS